MGFTHGKTEQYWGLFYKQIEMSLDDVRTIAQ